MFNQVDVNNAKYDSGVQQAFDDVRDVGISQARARFNSSHPLGCRPATVEDFHFDKGYSDGLVKCLWFPVKEGVKPLQTACV